ncbi:MAG: hypothetical protein ABI670_00735 [Chloroflexota bacterium]
MVYNIQPTTFVASVAREVKQHFLSLGNEPHSHVRGRLAQFWWGNVSTVHYELWLHERELQIEMGLHFEASVQRNKELYAAFSRRLLEIQHELGDSIWLEEWDRGWTRIYETQPLMPMDEARVYATAVRLCEIMKCLQPILDSLVVDE